MRLSNGALPMSSHSLGSITVFLKVISGFSISLWVDLVPGKLTHIDKIQYGI